MTAAVLTLTDLHQLAADASREATDLGAQLVLADDTGAPPEILARLEGELDRALQLEAMAWEAVTERETELFEQSTTWR